MAASLFNFFKKNPTYKFKESENTACFTCDHVITQGLPILYVAHDHDGSWDFLCGQEGHTEANAKLVALKEITQMDPSINDLYEMPQGVAAERKSVNDKWESYRLPEGE